MNKYIVTVFVYVSADSKEEAIEKTKMTLLDSYIDEGYKVIDADRNEEAESEDE